MGFLAAIPAVLASVAGGVGSAVAGAGAAIGSTFAGAAGATAAGSASSALSLGGMSTLLNTAGGIFSGVSAFQQGMFQKSIAQQNEAIAKSNQDTALAAGNSQEQLSRLRTGQMVGKEIAGAAAQGIDVSSGSAQAVQQATKLGGDFDALTIRYNAARQAYGYGIEAENDRLNASIAGQAAAGGLVGGLFKAGSSFLSGASSLADKWLQYKLNVPSDAGTLSFGDA